MSFSIIADSCCDFTPEMRIDPVYRSIPLTIHVGGADYVDDQNLDTSLLIYAMDQSPDASSSSCPSPGGYLDAFRKAEGDIYVVTLSALLSGSHNSAWQAKQLFAEEQPERNIHVFNSCSASAGEVLLAQKVYQLAKSGLPFAQVVAQAEQTITDTNTLFVLENLDNLKKNGRLTRVQAMLTGALRIKLIMGSTPEGEICKHGQALSIKQALSKLAEIMAADEKHKGKILYISQCLCPERAQQLWELAQKSCQFAGAVITATRGISSYYANSGGVVAAY
ncbi:MAG: DegV family EDD domain-containing protein [Clostridiales bacterium]|nr:DegV family EDD domain-containing protein [Clostridiales bacterium]